MVDEEDMMIKNAVYLARAGKMLCSTKCWYPIFTSGLDTGVLVQCNPFFFMLLPNVQSLCNAQAEAKLTAFSVAEHSPNA